MSHLELKESTLVGESNDLSEKSVNYITTFYHMHKKNIITLFRTYIFFPKQ